MNSQIRAVLIKVLRCAEVPDDLKDEVQGCLVHEAEPTRHEEQPAWSPGFLPDPTRTGEPPTGIYIEKWPFHAISPDALPKPSVESEETP